MLITINCANSEEQIAKPISGETFFHGNFDLDMHVGKPVLINFWFPSCPPCRAEMPDLQIAFEKYGEDEFRKIEKKILYRFLKTEKNLVIVMLLHIIY